MSDSRDVTGVWYGRYAGEGQSNSFIAMLEETGGTLSGSISEPDDEGFDTVRHALVSGRRSGSALAFVKQYDGAGIFAHAVDYWGTVNEEGTEVSGEWLVELGRGSFSMQREKFDVEALEDVVEAEAPLPLPLD